MAEKTRLRAVLKVGIFGAPAPVMPAASEQTLDAVESFMPVGETREGGCADLTTGTRTLDMMVSVPCAQPHEVRVLVHAGLPTGHGTRFVTGTHFLVRR
ncbi:hypothetical protein ABZY45_12845 [Streptomyces sp. NPDC006516]|uniref:hypothetical protein n=1 Tax=Streptomyces sp. NPDC006516 TaxID=3154309 RepID=UPI00339F95C4